jgi:signal transduction histidine kinase/ligand-binding sensor domain-containing protein/FixJ family two-component response regulator
MVAGVTSAMAILDIDRSFARRARRLRRPRACATIAVFALLFSQATGAERPDTPGFRFDPKPPITHLSSELGLSQNVVQCSLQDATGFLWFGTKDGLNRFDGYGFKVFRHDPNDPTSLSDSYVFSLCQDEDGRLWVGTRTGLDLFDPARESFRHVDGDAARENGVANGLVLSISSDRDGAVWLSTTNGGLTRLELRPDAGEDPLSGASFTHFPREGHDQVLPKDTVMQVAVDDGGAVWARTSHAVFRLARGTEAGDYTVSRFDDLDDVSKADPITSLHAGRGRMWLGSVGKIFGWDLATSQAREYRVRTTRVGVLAIMEDRLGLIWSISGDMTSRLDPKTGAVERLPREPETEDGLPSYGLSSLLEDRNGVVWLGSNGKGLYRWEARSRRFEHETGSESTPAVWRGRSVRSFCELDDGTLLVGMEGLYRVDRASGEATRLLADDLLPAVVEDRRGTIWIASATLIEARWRDGRLGEVARIDLGGLVRTVFEDRDGAIWAMTDTELIDLDPATGARTAYTYDTSPPPIQLTNNYPTIRQDSAGALWLGTSNGLLRFDRTSRTFARYTNDPRNPASLSHNTVLSIAEDPSDQGVLWLGTAGGGLNRLDTRTETFSVLTEEAGLPNNVVYSILIDEQGRLWMSTNFGLARFDPRTGTFRNFDVKDGLQDNEFNACAYLKTRSGELIFGGIDGFNIFRASEVDDSSSPPPVVITGLEILNKPVSPSDPDSPLRRSIAETRDLSVSYEQRFLAFEFAALDFTDPSENRYAHKLEGFDPDWVQLGTRRRAIYTNVPPGEYVLHAIAANSDGVWNMEGARIRIVVRPPFWLTWWFLSLTGASAVGLAFLLYRRRVTSLRRRQQALEATVAERTAELAATVERLKRSEESALEASAAKSVFLSSMSHELRTPLNAVLGFARLIARDRRIPPEQQENLKIIQRSGEHLLGLINDVLSISKIEAGKVSLEQRTFDLGELVGGVCAMMRDRAEARGLALVLEAGQGLSRRVVGDEGKLRQVLVNLLDNAVKFTESGSVTLRARWSDWAGGRVYFDVIDTGVGIAEEDVGKLFAAFVQTESGLRAKGGTGLGLTISRTLVELMGGEIRVESRPGEGSRFSFDVALPASEASVADEASRVVVGLEPGALGRAPRILVVDDTAENRLLLSKLLAATGFEVREASDGAQAIETWREWRPEMIFMDMRMPVMDGYEATRRIRNDECRMMNDELKTTPTSEGSTSDIHHSSFIIHHSTKIVALTASAFDHDRENIMSAGCDDFVSKPFRESRIFEVLGKHLGVRFAYAEDRPAARPDVDTISIPERLARIPADVVEALRRALDVGDDRGAAAALRRVREYDATLAEQFGAQIRNYEFDRVLEILEESRR